MPDVGIVMPVYKQIPIYLYQAIKSIRRQSYRRFHLVIVVDGVTKSVLRTIRKAKGKDRRIKVISRRQNQGVAKALNIGFRYLYARADIQYLTWVSSDNIYYKNYIRIFRNTLAKSPAHIGLVYSGFRHINGKGKPLFNKDHQREMLNWQNQPKENILDVCFVGASFMYRKSVAMKTGFYRLEPIEDYDYWLRLTEHCEIQFIPKLLMDYRVNSKHSISAQLQTKEQHRRWRLSYQLAKFEARGRRKIPLETTVIYPVNIASEHTIQMIESLYEQSYSNYKLIVIDISPSQAVTPMVHAVPDPRLEVIGMPNASVKHAIHEGARRAQTPFSFVYGQHAYPPHTLQNMINHLRQFPPHVISATTITNGNAIQARVTHPVNNPQFGELYRTGKLLTILGRK
ncbi:glycosyltransferase family 2 protein [Caldalkalibacillus salinus]|uniref:glycosyltransferase family 2 protein n=1 Tax=Caldalkalibacillus salinus TaxID=2803787 RepID=UPI0019244FB8|nr:glycosyltransferase [Caldalkalibacillus salinus]